MRVDVKPLSVNRLFQGRRFRTKEYDSYEASVVALLGNYRITIHDRMTLKLTVGLSNKNADLDNCAKAIIDILQKRLGFNDSHIYKIVAQKVIVAKGDEYFDFEISPYLE